MGNVYGKVCEMAGAGLGCRCLDIGCVLGTNRPARLHPLSNPKLQNSPTIENKTQSTSNAVYDTTHGGAAGCGHIWIIEFAK
jgi:hypothetical protein